MDDDAHTLLGASTAILVMGAGIVILLLGWRRSSRGERSVVALGALSPRQTVVSFLAVPVVGITTLLGIAIIAAALR